jgi:hypothetical protein
VIWERREEAFFAMATGPAGEVRFYLVVEPVGDDWDWAVWCPRRDQWVVCEDAKGTVQEAMQEAEWVAGVNVLNPVPTQ